MAWPTVSNEWILGFIFITVSLQQEIGHATRVSKDPWEMIFNMQTVSSIWEFGNKHEK